MITRPDFIWIYENQITELKLRYLRKQIYRDPFFLLKRKITNLKDEVDRLSLKIRNKNNENIILKGRNLKSNIINKIINFENLK